MWHDKWMFYPVYRKKDCSPADSKAISEEVQVLEGLLSQVWVQFVNIDWNVGAMCPLKKTQIVFKTHLPYINS